MAEQSEMDIVNTLIDDEGPEMNSQRSSLQSDGYNTCESGDESDGYNSGEEEQVSPTGQNEINTTQDGCDDSRKEQSTLLPGQVSKHPHQEISASKGEEKNTNPKKKNGIQSMVRNFFHKQQKDKYPEGIEKILSRISRIIGSAHGRTIGRELGLKEMKIKAIIENNPGNVEEQTYQILYCCVQQGKPYKDILDVLERLGEKAMVKTLEEIIVEDDDVIEVEHFGAPIEKSGELYIYEEKDCLHIWYKFDKERKKSIQTVEMLDKLKELFRSPYSRRMRQEPSQQLEELPKKESVQKFGRKLKEMMDALEHTRRSLKGVGNSIEALENATVNNQMLNNQSQVLVTFSEGEVENLKKIKEITQEIEQCEIVLSERLREYSGPSKASLKRMTVQMEVRMKQRKSLEKLLKCMLENFTKETPTQRHSMYPPSDLEPDPFRERSTTS